MTAERAPHRTDHRRGKLVVLAIIGLGLALGVVGYAFRRALQPRPTTRPATQPVTQPAATPADRPAGYRAEGGFGDRATAASTS